MTEVWDTPPLPTTADTDVELVYAGVGRVLSNWEGIEVQLFRLYSFFRFAPDDIDHMRMYGSDRIFKDRLKQLNIAASTFFYSRHDQEIEGEFDRINENLVGFSARRNDVAHGIVMPIQIYLFFQEAANLLQSRTNYWGLLPSVYKWEGHSLQAIPRYAYTSKELIELSNNMALLYRRLTTFRESLRMLV